MIGILAHFYLNCVTTNKKGVMVTKKSVKCITKSLELNLRLGKANEEASARFLSLLMSRPLLYLRGNAHRF